MRPRRLRVAVGADAEPAEVDQAHGHRADPLTVVRLALHVLGHRLAQPGQPLGEEHEPVVLRLLLLSAKVGVVEVLAPARLVDARRLQLRVRPR